MRWYKARREVITNSQEIHIPFYRTNHWICSHKSMDPIFEVQTTEIYTAIWWTLLTVQ